MANESAVLHTDDIRQAFADHNVAYMVADWTNQDDAITALLRRHERNGIPLYLMYAANTSDAPLVLPQILTKKTVLEALTSVSNPNSDAVSGL